MRRPTLRLPSRLAVSAALVASASACEPGYTIEDLGDGCVQYRSSAGAVSSVNCLDDAGCTRYESPDGALVRTVCPADAGCEYLIEPDGATTQTC